jgi:hypothetical protein
MIQTNEFALKKNDYLKIILLLRLRRSWWIFLLLIVIVLLSSSSYDRRSDFIFLIIYGVVYPGLIVLSSMRWVYSRDNRYIYLPKKLQFNSEKITSLSVQDTVFDTPTTNEIANNQIIKKLKLGNFYLLYTTKSNFLVVPINVFQCEDDREQFERLYRFS